MNRSAILFTLFALLLQPLYGSDDSAKRQEAIKKIEEAVANTNIFELPSFQMKANLEIESQGKLVDGRFQLLWNGPEQWKEEIRLPGYTEVQVGGKGTVWVQRSFLPLRVYDLQTALGFGTGTLGSGAVSASLVQTGLTPKDRIKKVRQRKERGEAQTCVEYENEVKRSLEICVNEKTGTLSRPSSSFLDTGIQPVGGGKVYPRSLSFVEERKTVATAIITDFTTSAQFPPNSFTPPPGVSAQAGCMNPVPPRLIKQVVPQYPENARRSRVQGTVAVDAWIPLDGIPRIGEVVGRINPDLERSAIAALRDWRYEPATCNGRPVEVETVFRVIYSLSLR